MSIKMKITVLFVALMWEHFASSVSQGSDMTVTYDNETTFTTPTTPTTTTTTTNTTTPTTSTTPTTPTRSTTPTTTSNLTTPVTTTPTTTTAATTTTKHQTPTPVTPNKAENNIGSNCERVTALSRKLYYIELAASALGGIVFTAICWCTYSMWHKHKKAKKAKALRTRKTSDQFPMYGGKKNYFNNDTRSVYSIEPCDSASQVGVGKPRYVNHLNRNQQPARQAQKANQRGANQGAPRKISVTHDVPNENDELDEVQSKDDIINKLADKFNAYPELEKVVRQQAKERINCHYETDINDDTDIKIILGGFGVEILKDTLSDMESQIQSYPF